MLKVRKGCKTCEMILAGDTKLEKRLNESRQWVQGGESITAIHEDYKDKVGYLPMRNHAMKHQAPGKKQILIKQGRQKLKEIEEQKAYEVGKALSHHDARKQLTQLGMEQINEGQVKMTAAAVVQLLKQEMDIEEKAKDRTAELMKTFNYFASGEARVSPKNIVEGEIVE